MKKVIIVGNGASVLQRELGDQIDAFDVIVRINDFKIEGFEQHVGTRTDILFTCRLDIYNSLYLISKFPEVILSLYCNPWNGVYTKSDVFFHRNITDEIYPFQARALGGKVGMKWPKYPSTGLICIDYMIERYGHVTIAGFDNFKGGNLHYYEEGKRMSASTHAPEIQKKYLLQLEKKGLLSRL